MTIDKPRYMEEMRMRLGRNKDDDRYDKDIEDMAPLQRVRLIAGWYHGYGEWADKFKDYFESQGLYLTTNPEADGVI